MFRFVSHTGSWETALDLLPPAVIYGFAVLVGLVIGSFLNVVIHRLPRMLLAQEADYCAEPDADANIACEANDGPKTASASTVFAPSDHQRYNLCFPPSSCPHCGQRLRLRDNVPVLSYLALRGRCAHCGGAISAAYPLVEMGTALMAAFFVWRYGCTLQALAGFGLGCTLLALAMIDARHLLLPDPLTLPLMWAGLLVNIFATFTDLQDAVIGAAAGYVSLWLVYWLFLLVRKKEGMGYGDFKMLAAIGAWLGWQSLPLVTLVAAVLGAIYGIALQAKGLRPRDAPLPFGTFLAIGAAFALTDWLAILS